MSFFERFPTPLLKEVIRRSCDQKDRRQLAQCCKAIYKVAMPLLYERIVILVGNVPLNINKRKRNYEYPTDYTLVTGRKSLNKLLRTLIKQEYNYSGSIKLSNLIYSIRCFHIVIPEGIDHSNMTVSRLTKYQFDCGDDLHETQKTKISDSLTAKVLKLFVHLKYCCIDIQFPNSVYANLSHNVRHFDFIRSLKMERGVNKRNLAKLVKMLYTGELLMDLYKIGTSLRMTLNNVSSLSVSFADPNMARKIIANCDSVALKKLTLSHLTCTHAKADVALGVQINRKFHLYDEFFKNPQVANILSHLKDLTLVTHNGFNRVLFRKFWFALFHMYVSLKGKLQLTSLRFLEVVGDYSKIKQLDSRVTKLTELKIKDVADSFSTIHLMADLLHISPKFNIFGLINFKKLKRFELIMNCFPAKMDNALFEAERLSDFEELLQEHKSEELTPTMYTKDYASL